MLRWQKFSRRDAILVLLGAMSIHLISLVFNVMGPAESSLGRDMKVEVEEGMQGKWSQGGKETVTKTWLETVTKVDKQTVTERRTATKTAMVTTTATPLHDLNWSYDAIGKILDGEKGNARPHSEDVEVPPTRLVGHAPGWTMYRDLYMSNGTLFIVTDGKLSRPSLKDPENSRDRQPDMWGLNGEDLTWAWTKAEGWPELRQMASKPLTATGERANIIEREPSDKIIQFITTAEAKKRWGKKQSKDETRVWIVKGNTVGTSST